MAEHGQLTLISNGGRRHRLEAGWQVANEAARVLASDAVDAIKDLRLRSLQPGNLDADDLRQFALRRWRHTIVFEDRAAPRALELTLHRLAHLRYVVLCSSPAQGFPWLRRNPVVLGLAVSTAKVHDRRLQR